MAHDSSLPCDADGLCMLCKATPSEEEKLVCATCATPWHVQCLAFPPQTLSSTLEWQCPDCSPPCDDQNARSSSAPSVAGDLIAAIRAIEDDGSLSDAEKARRRQDLMSGGISGVGIVEKTPKPEKISGKSKNTDSENVLDLFDESLNCSFCMQLPERPVTTPCGHNFCLKCFQKWVGQGKNSCAKCRQLIPSKMASQPRINSALVVAIRMARNAKTIAENGPLKVHHFMRNQSRPDKAFTTERAKKAGKANACSGKIFVTIPPDHFGPILAENDPERKQGVLVGESWEDRMECRQWGAHFPHVAGIAGQSEHGAQSVALSGGYEDDEDHGEWFLYTGSGGRDLSGNKRTNKEQSFDQKFDKSNEALRVSCKKGYPVRVVRSHKEKRSSYAPEVGVRYDGIYRIEKCWRKVGKQGFKVCRYLFVRCDNEPAPWTSDENGDRPRPLPIIKELKSATDITERKESPAWDYIEEQGWKWTKPPPVSKQQVKTENPEERKRARIAVRQAQHNSVRERLLKEFSCQICHNVMTLPLTTPCAHNFCKPCLEGLFAGKAFLRERNCGGARTLRAQKTVMTCPRCPNDISEFLQNPQVNRELMDVIESLKRKNEEKDDVDDDDSSINNLETGDDNATEVAAGEFVIQELHDDAHPIASEANPAEKTEKCKRKTSDGGGLSNEVVKKARIGHHEVEPDDQDVTNLNGVPEIVQVPSSCDEDNEGPIKSKSRKAYKPKTRSVKSLPKKDVKKIQNGKKCEESGTKNSEAQNSGDKDGESPTVDSESADIYKQENGNGDSLSLLDDERAKCSTNSEEMGPLNPVLSESADNNDEKPPSASKRKTRNGGSLSRIYAKSKCSKSKETRPTSPVILLCDDEDTKPITESETVALCQRKTRNGGCISRRNATYTKNTKKSEFVPKSSMAVESDDKDVDDPITESKTMDTFSPKVPNERKSLKADVKKAKTSGKQKLGPDSSHTQISGAKDRDVLTTQGKTSELSRRKTRSRAFLSNSADVKSTEKSKSKVVSGNSPSSPFVVADNDDDFE